MPQKERLAFIAEGLPIILASAQGFWNASLQLSKNPREADVLEGFAQEEAAKILILMDVVRCPPKTISGRLGKLIDWFYSHLARLIYADAVAWKPVNVAQLREYVKPHREAHYLEGSMGEYIVPNWAVYQRESKLYADIEAYEDGGPGWSEPKGHSSLLPNFKPRALVLAESMAALGLFTADGLRATSDIWQHVEFKDTETSRDAARLTQELLQRLLDLGLPTSAAEQEHVNSLYNDWQLPMYDFDLSIINIPLDELKERQEMLYISEVNIYY
jgi:hypothetical protein